MDGHLRRGDLPLDALAVTPEAIVGYFVALLAHPFRQSTVIAKAALGHAALDFGAEMSREGNYDV